MKFSTKIFFSKCDLIQIKLRIWSPLLKKSFIENFIFFCAVNTLQKTTNCINNGMFNYSQKATEISYKTERNKMRMIVKQSH